MMPPPLGVPVFKHSRSRSRRAFQEFYAEPSRRIVMPVQQRVVAAGAFVIVIAITILVSARAPGSGGSGALSNDGQNCVALKSASGLPNASTVITAADPRPEAGPRPAPNAFAPPTSRGCSRSRG